MPHSSSIMNLPISEEIHEAPADTITMRLMAGATGQQRIRFKADFGHAKAGAPGQRIDPGLRLFADLLAQIMRITAFGGGDGVPSDASGGARSVRRKKRCYLAESAQPSLCPMV